MIPNELRAYDLRLLLALKENPHLSFQTMSRAVGIPPLAADKRVQRLIDRGYLEVCAQGALCPTERGIRAVKGLEQWDSRIASGAQGQPPVFSWRDPYIPRDFEG